MDFNTADRKEVAYIMAQFAKDAYIDHCGGTFKEYGLDTDYRMITNEKAHGHLVCNDKYMVITFRGTNPKQMNDLIADVDFIKKTNGPGKVHEGFRREARKLYDMVLDYIKQHPNKQIYVAGHSLGGAMATYMAQEIKWLGLGDPILYTFGSPRLGDSDYVDAMNVTHLRFVNCCDAIPHVPPAATGFKHHGELHYINYYGFIRDLTRWQRIKDWLRSHYFSIIKGKFFTDLFDHFMDNYVHKIDNHRKNG